MFVRKNTIVIEGLLKKEPKMKDGFINFILYSNSRINVVLKSDSKEDLQKINSLVGKNVELSGFLSIKTKKNKTYVQINADKDSIKEKVIINDED